MNWNTIEQSWNEFAKLHGVEPNYNQRNLFHAIECTYKVDFKADYGNAQFLGTLWKSQDGDNRNHTHVLIKFNSQRHIDNFEIKKRSVKNLFLKKKQTNFEKTITQRLRDVQGKTLTLKDNILEIRLTKIISSMSEFEEITKLISEIKNKD